MTTYKIAVSSYPLERKIADGDTAAYRKLTGSFVNHELDPFDLAAMIYDGHAFTTWHSNSWRHRDNYLAGQHIALDFDAGDKTSTIPALLSSPFIAKHSSIIYTTPSHTADKPRARAVFVLDAPIMQAANYALAATALVWLFSGADRACKDPCRSWYGSKGCNMELPYRVLPIATVKHLIRQYKETGERERRRQQRAITEDVSDAYVQAALTNEIANVQGAGQGMRNHTLNAAAFNLYRFLATGQLQQATIDAALTNAALAAGLGEQEIVATLRSALRSQSN